MKDNNKGVSLVELLVAMAVMGVLATMLFISMGIIPRTAARSCANELKTSIGQTRIMTMGKKETIFELSRDAQGLYYTAEKVDNGSGVYTTSTPEMCGKSYLKVSYHVENGTDPLADPANYIVLNNEEKMTLKFDRGSGKLTQGGAEGGATLCDAIQIEGGSKVYTIRIYTATGKIDLND